MHRVPLAALLALACPLTAAAQAPAAAPNQPPQLREVERGFSIGSEIGGVYFFDLPGKGTQSASGAVLGVHIGVDAGPLNVGLVAWGQALGAGADYRGVSGQGDPHRARGDFQTTLVGLDLRLGIPLGSDTQGVPRTSLVIRGLAGPTLSSPVGVLEERGVMAALGAGLEYHTRVRHFSIGLDALGVMHLQGSEKAVGLAVLPGLRYTF